MDAPTEVGLPAPRGKVFTLTLDKAVETWWRSVVPGHPEIDATGVDSTQSVDSYDDETQAAIRKIMWEEDQRRRAGPPPGPLGGSGDVVQAELMMARERDEASAAAAAGSGAASWRSIASRLSAAAGSRWRPTRPSSTSSRRRWNIRRARARRPRRPR